MYYSNRNAGYSFAPATMASAPVYSALIELRSTKQTTRLECLERINSALAEASVAELLATDARFAHDVFRAVRTALNVNFEKAERSSRSVSDRTLHFSTECGETLSRVVKIANSQATLISFSEYLSYVKMCVRGRYHRQYVLTQCLRTFLVSFLRSAQYWIKLTYTEINDIIATLKAAHASTPACGALACYLELIETGVHYRVPATLVHDEFAYIYQIAMQIRSRRDDTYLLRFAMTALCKFADICASSHRESCARNGEQILAHLLKFVVPSDRFSNSDMCLLENYAMQLELHSDMAPDTVTAEWNGIIKQIYAFVNLLIAENDSSAFQLTADGVDLKPMFRKVAVYLYKQYKRIHHPMDGEPRKKRVRFEMDLCREFVDEMHSIDRNVSDSWVCVFTAMIAAYPEEFKRLYIQRVLNSFLSKMKVDISSALQGTIFHCCCTILHVEEKFLGYSKDTSMDTEWSSMLDVALRTAGLNQNEKKTHSLLQSICTKKHHLVDGPAFLNMYISNPILHTEITLTTLNVFGSKCVIPESLGALVSVRKTLIDYILDVRTADAEKSMEHFDLPITADVIANLTLKSWANHRSAITTNDFESNVIKDVYTHLKDRLLSTQSDVLSLSEIRTQNAGIELLLKFALLLANIYCHYQRFEQVPTEMRIEEFLLDTLNQLVWPQLIDVLLNIRRTEPSENIAPLRLLCDLLQTDENINNVIKLNVSDAIVTTLAVAQCNIELENAAFESPNVELKLLLTRIFTKLVNFDVPAYREGQTLLKRSLYRFDEFNSCNSVDYAQWKIIAESLAHTQCCLQAEHISSILDLLENIFCHRCEHHVIMELVQTLYHLLSHLARLVEDRIVITERTLRILYTFHEKRGHFGYLCSLNIVKCFGLLAQLDSTFAWAKLDNALCALQLLDYMQNEHVLVEQELVTAFSQIFANTTTNSEAHKLKCSILEKIVEKLKQRLRDGSSSDLVINILARISIVDNGNSISSMSICALFDIYNHEMIDKRDMEQCARIIQQELKLHRFLKPIVNVWLQKHTIAAFPCEMFGSASIGEFYETNLRIIVPLMLKAGLRTDCAQLCANLQRNFDEDVKQCHVVLFVERLISKGLQGAPRTNEALEDLLHDDLLKSTVRERTHEVIVEMLQYFYDPKFFPQPSNTHFSMPYEDELILARPDVTRVWARIGHIMETNLTQLMYEKPSNIQRILLALRSQICDRNDVATNSAHFYRFVVCLNQILPLPAQLSKKYGTYIIREVCYTLIHIIEHERGFLQAQAVKFMLSFIRIMLHTQSWTLNEFAIVVCSSMLPYAVKGNRDAVSILRKIFHSHDSAISNALKYLDPLPDIPILEGLRKKQLTFRHTSYTLEKEIELFVAGKQYIDCRIEGLKYLRHKIGSDLMGRKHIYDHLQTQGPLKQDSLLHRLICSLVELTKSSNTDESNEAILCLGVVGAGDLSTMILRSSDDVTIDLDIIALFIGKLLDVLYAYSTEADVKLANLVASAFYGILATKQGQRVLKQKDDTMIGYTVPFMVDTPTNECRVVAETLLIDDEILTNLSQFWYPANESTTFDQWISQLCIHLLRDLFLPFAELLIPIIEIKLDFAIQCLPYILNIIASLNKVLRHFVLNGIRDFLRLHWESNLAERESFATNKAALNCILNVVYFIRLQDSIRKPPNALREFNVNFLHAALAAQHCSAHLSALIYVEKYIRQHLMKRGAPLCLDELCGAEERIAIEILRASYDAIGDADALDGCNLPIAMNQPLPRTMANEQFALTKFDCAVTPLSWWTTYNAARALLSRGLSSAAFAVAESYPLMKDGSNADYTELSCEAKWRLSTMNEHFTKLTNDGIETNVYNILHGIKDKDLFIVRSSLHDARRGVAERLKDISLGCCNAVYGPLSHLERLHELEELYELVASNGDLVQWTKRCELRDSIQYKFEYIEPRLAQRIVALNILKQANYPAAAALHATARLHLADFARKNNQYDIAMRHIEELKTAPIDDGISATELVQIKGTASIIELQIYWDMGKLSSGRKLNKLLKAHPDPTYMRATMLQTCGDWMAKSRSAYPQRIIDGYYMKSIEILDRLDPLLAKHVETKQMVFHAIAKFADEQYQYTNEVISSPEFAYKIKSMARMKETAKKLRGLTTNNKETMRASLNFERFANVDESEIEEKNRERFKYLYLAVKFYLHHIKHSDVVDKKIFRVFSLWLENRNDKIARMIEGALCRIESFKILPIIPQLVPHIVGDTENFVRTVRSLVERCATDHPYHVISFILCVANTNADDEYASDSAKIKTNGERIVMARKIIERLRAIPKLTNIVRETELISSAIIELAYARCDGHQFVLPASLKVAELRNLKYGLVPTCVPAVRRDLDYSNVITLKRFKMHGCLVGGMNKPKRIKCVGSDGVTRTLLVKSRDDLRQDAVMQQVFSMMNEFFRESKDTRNFQIRTYQVIPMSKRSGVVEWVENTIPLGDYLTTAHSLYHPQEWDVHSARQYVKSKENTSFADRHAAYSKICAKMTPVFHRFFETTYPHPSIWYERRRAYTQSAAITSMCGYILGIGDRHTRNILVDKNTGQLVHIDFGIAFEQGSILPFPETVPFRLTREIVDGMGVFGVEGTFTRTCERAMETLRLNAKTIQTIVEVLLYDPLYAWSITPKKALSKQLDASSYEDTQLLSDGEDTQSNVPAGRALSRLKQKLKGADFGNEINVQTQVDTLIQRATDPSKLSRMFNGWQSFL